MALAKSSWITPTQCAYCGESRLSSWLTDVRDRLNYVPGSWSFLKCKACGSAQLSPVPLQEEIAGLYPDVYTFRPDFETTSTIKRVISLVESRTLYWLLHWNEVAMVRRQTGISEGTLLDVGCGTGERLGRFADAGFEVRGMEIQSSLADYVSAKVGCEVDVGTLDTVSYPLKTFDVVTIFSVIEHLIDVGEALKKIHGILKPNGWIVAEIPLADSYQSRLLGRRWSGFSEAPRHIALPSQKGLIRSLTDAGFTDVMILPSPIANCAGCFGLSVVPKAATRYVYGEPSVSSYGARLLAVLVTALYLPAAMVENYILRRPPYGLIFARKSG